MKILLNRSFFQIAQKRIVKCSPMANRKYWSPWKLLEGVPWSIEGMGLHETLLKEVPWPIKDMGHHGTLIKEVPWPIEDMEPHGTL